MKFRYTGTSEMGEELSGELEALSEADAREILMENGITPQLIVTLKGSSGTNEKTGSISTSKSTQSSQAHIPLEEIVYFAKQMALMLETNVPLLQCLEVAALKNPNEKMNEILAQVHERVQQGENLSTAFSMHPGAFDTLFCNMIAAGETAGQLHKVFEHLAQYLEKRLDFRRRVVSSLTYPLVVLLVATFMVLFLLGTVIPTFAEFFQSFGPALPTSTQFLIKISGLIQRNFMFFCAGIFASGAAFYFCWVSSTIRTSIDELLLHLPLIGPLFQKIASAQFARTFALLIENNVHLLASIEVAATVSGNKIFEKSLQECATGVAHGQSLSALMGQYSAFPTLLVQMLNVGETSGQIAAVAHKVADYYEKDSDSSLKQFTNWLEPALMIFIGLIVAAILYSLYVPIFEMASTIEIN